MPKDTKTLGNSKARACESLGFVHKKGCARVLTHLQVNIGRRTKVLLRNNITFRNSTVIIGIHTIIILHAFSENMQ